MEFGRRGEEGRKSAEETVGEAVKEAAGANAGGNAGGRVVGGIEVSVGEDIGLDVVARPVTSAKHCISDNYFGPIRALETALKSDLAHHVNGTLVRMGRRKWGGLKIFSLE